MSPHACIPLLGGVRGGLCQRLGVRLLLSTFFLVFNTFRNRQIEMKTSFLHLCKAVLWLRFPCFNPFNLQFQPFYPAICITLLAKATLITIQFDADYIAFRRKLQRILTSKDTLFPLKQDNHLIIKHLARVLKTRVFRPKGKLFLNSRAI